MDFKYRYYFFFFCLDCIVLNCTLKSENIIIISLDSNNTLLNNSVYFTQLRRDTYTVATDYSHLLSRFKFLYSTYVATSAPAGLRLLYLRINLSLKAFPYNMRKQANSSYSGKFSMFL